MRAKEFLNEDPYYANVRAERGNLDEYLATVAEQIRQACGPFIQANRQALLSGQFMYRGIKGAHSSELAIEGTVRTDRIPRDTPNHWHVVLDKFFQQQFGITYRSSALFATTDINNTVNYGAPFVIFPKGEFKMCYSPIIDDITVDLAGGVSNSGTGLSPAVVKIIMSIPPEEIQRASRSLDMNINDWPEFMQAIRDFSHQRIRPYYGLGYEDYFPDMLASVLLPKLRYQETQRFTDAGDSEIMVKCNEYYGIRVARREHDGSWMRLIHMILS